MPKDKGGLSETDAMDLIEKMKDELLTVQ